MPECLLKRKNPGAFWLWQESGQLKEDVQSSQLLFENNKIISERVENSVILWR
jgi:hypothetical protein